MKRKVFVFCFVIFVIGLLLFLITKPNNSCEGPYLTFTFDDGYQDQYEYASPILEKYGFNATSYIIAGSVDGSFENETLMGWEEIRNLSDGGWEIGSHTYSQKDLTNLNDSSVNFELSSSKEVLEEKGFDVKSLSIPYGKYSSRIEDLAKNHYSSVRPSNWGDNNLGNINKYNLSSYWLVNSASIKSSKSRIDGIEKDEWGIMMLHHVRPNSDRKYSIKPGHLEKISKYIKGKDIKVRKLSYVLEKCT